MKRDLRQFQLEETRMLIQLAECLKKADIPFYLIGGSCLGAIRHKGFIPWDDDIDIGIFRRDFDKAEKALLNISGDLVYDCVEKHIFPDGPLGHLYKNEQPLDTAPKIDVFAIDTVPDSLVGRKIQKLCSMVYHVCILRRPALNRGKFNKLFTSFICTCFPKFLLDFLQRVSYKGLTHWKNSNEECVSNIYGGFGDWERVPVAFYGKTRFVEFENTFMPIPEKAEEYMSHIYGDYMSYPPESERKPTHFIDMFGE